MSTKAIIWTIVGISLLIGGTCSYLFYFKPMMDKEKEEKRKAGTNVLASAVTNTVDPKAEKPVVILTAEPNTIVGLGGQKPVTG